MFWPTGRSPFGKVSGEDYASFQISRALPTSLGSCDQPSGDVEAPGAEEEGRRGESVSPQEALRPKERLLEFFRLRRPLKVRFTRPEETTGSPALRLLLAHLLTPSEPQAACASLDNIFQGSTPVSFGFRQRNSGGPETTGADGYKYYQIPDREPSFHQIRLRLGNDLFLKVMKSIHETPGRNPPQAQILHWRRASPNAPEGSLHGLVGAGGPAQPSGRSGQEGGRAGGGGRDSSAGTTWRGLPLKDLPGRRDRGGALPLRRGRDEKQIPFSFTTSSKPSPWRPIVVSASREQPRQPSTT